MPCGVGRSYRYTNMILNSNTRIHECMHSYLVPIGILFYIEFL